MRTRTTVLAAAAALLMAGALPGPAAAAGPAADPSTMPAGCVLARDLSVDQGGPGVAAALATRTAVAALGSQLAAKFGDPTTVTLAAQLERGLIGVSLNSTNGRYSVVVDPARTDTAALTRRLSAMAPGGVTVDVRPGCFSAQRILAAGSVLAARSWHPTATSTRYTYFLDPVDSTYHVAFDVRDTAVGDALRRRLGAVVTVEYDKVAPRSMAGGRYTDSSPHLGGANIARMDTGAGCTSGFAVRNRLGTPTMVTAGHCAGHNQVVDFESSDYYGTSLISIETATQDMALLHNFVGGTYDRRIYTDPGAPLQRTVTGKADPVLQQQLCVSGSMSLASCSIRVISLNAGSACNDNGTLCTHGLFIGERTDRDIVQPGDSGGPIYSRSGDTGATINGMIIGMNTRRRVVGHRVSQVEAGLGVTVMVN